MIGLSAAGFKKNDRVVVRLDKNEWYIGTIERSGKTVSVDFDDGHEADIEAEDFEHVKVVDASTKPRKKFLTDAQAKALYAKSSPRALVEKVLNNEALDEKLTLLPRQQFRPGPKATNLQRYLIGDPVPSEWISALSKRRASEQTSNLYRMCLVDDSSVGRTVSISKPVCSASDRPMNAVFAGCSYILGDGGPGYNPNKKLALVKLNGPKVVLSHEELKSIVADNPHFLKILNDEREYLVAGPVKGKVIAMLNSNLLSKNRYIKALKFVQMKSYSPEKEQKLLKELSL